MAIGIIGGTADCVPAGAAEMAGVPATCIAVPAAVTGGAAPVQADGTVSAPTEVARPTPAESAGAPEPTAPMPAEPRAPVLDVSPTAFAAPSSLAAVVAALAAVAVLPAVNSLDIMLMGIDANFSGVLSSFMIDVADVEDVDESVAVDATLSRACGDARLCRACGIPEMSCGPDDMIVSTSVALEVPADWAAAADWLTRPLELVVCGGVVNGVTCDAVAEAPA